MDGVASLEARAQLRSALFVDFDNIYLSLEARHRPAAERFALSPDLWLSWLEQELPEPERRKLGGASSRRFLVRRCYANPLSFGRFRASFVRSGFEVIDTPPLTQHGKTSADVHMVIDILDTLALPTRLDEFLICSGDADFTPVLIRLRKHDRRTTVLAVGPAASAFMAASDVQIPEALLLERGLRLGERELAPPAPEIPTTLRELLERMALRVREQATVTGKVAATDLVPLYSEFREFSSGNDWLGFGALRPLTQAIVSVDGQLRLKEEDDWGVELVEPPERAAGPPDRAEARDREGRGLALAQAVRQIVDDSESAVELAELALRLRARFPDLAATGWDGAGSLTALLRRLDLGGLRISTAGFRSLFDPNRHAEPGTIHVRAARLERLPPAARRVCGASQLPPLEAHGWAALRREIAKEVDARGFHAYRTSKAVRDAMNGKGFQIGRSEVNEVLGGLETAGHRFDDRPQDPASLSAALLRFVSSLAERAQLELDEAERSELAGWLTQAAPPLGAPDPPAALPGD